MKREEINLGDGIFVWTDETSVRICFVDYNFDEHTILWENCGSRGGR